MRRLLALNSKGKLALRSANGTETSAVKRHNALLLIDTSGSMAGTKIEQSQRGALSFARSASLSSYATAVAVFGDRSAMVCDPTVDAARFESKISQLSVGMVGQNTYLAEGLILAGKLVDLAAVVIVTDGHCHDGDDALLVASILKSRGVEIICIGTDDADIDFLKQIASRSESATHVEARYLQSTIADASRLLPTG